MNIQLIEGEFESKDAIELIVQLVHVKIRYHENKINNSINEEDIKYRESKIKSLQNDLFEVIKEMISKNQSIKMNAEIIIQ